MAFHLGRDKEAKLLLEKVSLEMQMLAVDEEDLMEIVRYSITIHGLSSIAQRYFYHYLFQYGIFNI